MFVVMLVVIFFTMLMFGIPAMVIGGKGWEERFSGAGDGVANGAECCGDNDGDDGQAGKGLLAEAEDAALGSDQ